MRLVKSRLAGTNAKALSACKAASVFVESSPPSVITLGISWRTLPASLTKVRPMPVISSGITTTGTTIIEIIVRRSRSNSRSSLR